MKKIIAFALIVITVQSCCIRRKTNAQSDRFDTHNPFLPIVECIECGNLQNRAETMVWTEAYGATNKWMIGIESGYNLKNIRLFADAGTHWWPGGTMSWAHREQIGIVLFNPNWLVRPEFGAGLQQRYYRSGTIVSTPNGDQFVRKPHDLLWQSFGGLRVNVPATNMILSLRAYRIRAFQSPGTDWNVGIQLGFRL